MKSRPRIPNPQPELEAARAELRQAKAHEEHLAQLVAEGKVNADALSTAQYRVSNAGKNLSALLAEAAPVPVGPGPADAA